MVNERAAVTIPSGRGHEGRGGMETKGREGGRCVAVNFGDNLYNDDDDNDDGGGGGGTRGE